MSELKMCPFCNKQPETANVGIAGTMIGVRCMDIQCPMHHAGFFTVEDWNTRPIEDQLRAENAKLREALEEIGEVVTKSDWGLQSHIDALAIINKAIRAQP